MQRRAVVIGAGVSGLATARGLLDQGWHVEVHERAPALPETGSSLAMWPAAVEALRRFGLAALVERAATTTAGACLLRPDGTALATVASRTQIRLVERPALLAQLAQGPPGDAVRWSSAVADEASLRAVATGADLVVGADGIGSPVRRLLLGRRSRRCAARPLGSIAVRGTALLSHPVRGGRTGMTSDLLETWGQGSLWGTTPRSDGLTNTYACLRGRTLAEVRADPVGVLGRAFRGWHDGVLVPLGALDPATLDVRELFDLPGAAPVVAPRRSGLPAVVVLGDAAHAMAPNLGRGACEALLDADALCRHLAGTADGPPDAAVRAALQRYDGERRRRGQRAVLGSRLAHHLGTARHGTALRDGAVRLAGSLAARVIPAG